MKGENKDISLPIFPTNLFHFHIILSSNFVKLFTSIW